MKLSRKQLLIVVSAVGLFTLFMVLRLILDPQARGVIDVTASYDELGAQLSAAGLLYPPDTLTSIKTLEGLAMDPEQVIAEQVVTENNPSVRIKGALSIHHQTDDDQVVRVVILPGGYDALNSKPLRRTLQTLNRASRGLQARVLSGSEVTSPQSTFSYTYTRGVDDFILTPSFHGEECVQIDIVRVRH